MHQNSTVLTREANWSVQLDKCYVIVEVVWVVLGMSDGPNCKDSHCTRF